MNVKLSGIELSYSYKKVLQGVDVEFSEGKIHALLGENGAGKSSLMKILTGFIKPAAGRIFLDEKEVHFRRPADSLKCGIACVYQRPFLSESLSVSDNLKIGLNKTFSEKDLFLPEEIKPGTKVKDLTGDQRFFVAFAASLLRKPEVLILDEPTALLNEEQGKLLFAKLRELASGGMNIIVITHKPEDLQYCDEVTWMSGGKCSSEDREKISSENIKNIDIENFAVKTASEENMPKEKLNPEKCFSLRKEGTAVIPSDRTYLASNPELTITQLICSTYKESSKPAIRRKHTEEIIRKAEINILPEEKACNLSGGMLQRLILERELFGNPKVIYLEDPFQGLDGASCKRLEKRLAECEKNGSRVVVL